MIPNVSHLDHNNLMLIVTKDLFKAIPRLFLKRPTKLS